MSERPRFLADEMLGKLARDLRALGYDAGYMQHVEDEEVLERARREDRWLLTRDAHLSDRAGERGLLIGPRDPEAQLDRLVERLELVPDPERFLSRCLDCNTPIEPTDAEDEVPEGVRERQHWRCPSCGKVYWLGTHAQDMLDRLGRFLPEAPDGLESSERPGSEA